MRIGTRIAIGFISALVVVLSLGGLSWRGASELLQTVRRVDHTHDVLTEADAMLEDLVDVEHGTRGYVITGRKEFLEPYQRGIGRLPGDLTQLQALVADNPAQLRRVAALGEVIQRRLEHAANVVALRGSQGFDAAAYQVSVGTGKSIMDEARQQLALFRTEELRLLDEQTARVTKRAALAFGFIAAFVASVVVLLLAAILILTRSLTKPLRALVANARELGAGGKPAITGTERQDEIGDLARAIDDMAQKRAKAEALRRALLEDAPDPFFLADLEGRFTDVNAAACALLGYRREELIGMSIADIIPPEDVPRLAAAKERLLAPGVVEVAEWTHRSRDGVLIPVEVSTKILEGGHWQAFVRDIRKRKRIEDERQVFVSLLENSSDFIGIADPNGKPIYVNPAGRRMVGLPADYPIEQTQIPEYYPPDQRSFAADVILKSMIEHGHWSGETFFRHWQTQEAIPVSDEHFMIREPKSGRLLGMGTITRDISEARRINERLRQSEERFRLIVESVGDYAIFMLDPNGIVTSWNLGAERIEGYRADEIVGQHFSRFYSDEEVRAGVCARELEEAARVGRVECEGWRARKDGSRFWANVVMTAVRDPMNGRLIGFSRVSRDLTERRRAEEALRESEERFRLTIDEAPIGMALVALEGRFVRVNRALCEIVGYDPAELTGLTFQAITHPDDLVADLALLGRLVRGEIPRYQLEKRYIRKDGALVDIMLSTSILRDRDGAPLYYIAQIEDITERKRAEAALRESEQRLSLALDSAQMGIWDSDLIADTTVRSKRHDQIFGHPSPIPDWNMAVLLSHVVPADRDIVRQRFEEAFASGVFEMECRLAWEDGSIHWISSHGRVYRNLEGVPSRMLGTIMDITERKRAEEALQRSEQEFRSLAESMPQIVWATRPDGWNIYFNQQWVDYTGLTLEESYGEGWITPFHPDDRQRAWDAWQRATQHRDTYALECRLRRADGVYRWWLIRGVPLLNATGEISKWFGTCTDIEDIKVAEQRLKESEAKFSGIVSISADAIISIDDEQRITIFNEGAEKIFGYSKAEAVGAALDMLIPERFRTGHRQHVAGFAVGSENARPMGERLATIAGLRKNGEEFPAEAAISRLKVGDKTLLTVALRDITQRTRIEKEQRFLAEAGASLSATLDYEQTLATVARLVVRDFADWCFVEIMEEHAPFRRLVVVSSDPANASLCAHLQQLTIDRDRPHLIRSVIETKQPLLIEHVTPELIESVAQGPEHLQALRAIRPISLMALPLLRHGQLLGTLAFISSTPSRLYRAADLRLAEALVDRAAVAIENARLYRASVQATQLRDQVLGVVAHDLRNPLSAILMQASALQRRGPEPERRSQKPREIIHRAATRMQRLIQDLLDVARMEEGVLPVKRARLAVAELIDEAVDMQRPLAASSSLDIRLELGRDLPEISGDRDRLLQVFENLIGNAMKFTKTGGSITVGADSREHEVVFRVADTGLGIAAENLPHVFDRFWQATRADRLGAGLGLPITKGIVEAHGGRIWVESTLGRGTTFFFSIPQAHPAGDRPAEVIH